ncbi:hypothetical protein Y717_11220 [Streptomyces scopuliridis RB72]|uniref:Uncharacterized protein n=1 Tax=Streptomyces scopuliridis RB72 TaxID=1440053 RepID=A0A2T7SNT3_9ACTN|nr:hypothetical protein Y717_11220 [Streptomyces scopuliridis RB72]
MFVQFLPALLLSLMLPEQDVAGLSHGRQNLVNFLSMYGR